MKGSTVFGRFLLPLLFLAFAMGVCAQKPKPLLGDTVLLEEIKVGLDYIYNADYKNAIKAYETLKMERPNHPVTPFFYGLSLYWGKNPKVFEDDDFDEFINAMRETLDKARPMWEADEYSIEGVFFDLVARAMLMMYYADKGHSGQVIKIAPTAYRHLQKSFELNEKFKEFYFITGLYNYYIVAYPQKNPVYKPITLLFRSGDKETGLSQLHYALDSTVFMKNEAGMFLSIIYYDFERNTKKAEDIMGGLYDNYPENPYIASQYAEYLLSNEKYEQCQEVIKYMVRHNRSHGFVVMKAIIMKALIEEKYNQKYEKAYNNYKLGIEIAEKYGDHATDFLGYAYYGLSRLEKMNGNEKQGKTYFKKAESFNRYGHFKE